MSQAVLGVVGGSGLYDLPGLTKLKSVRVRTPYGAPSDAISLGELNGVTLAFLPRHGHGHRLLPSEINYRANLWALKRLGVERVIAFSAVGSMKEAIAPGHFVIVDQYIDRTQGRASTFFGDGVVAHASLAEPTCPDLSRVAAEAAESVGATVHVGGSYLCIEGPQFSTRAESALYRSWGVDVIGMTNLPEARLAREAGLCYASIALATDYDSWRAPEEDVTAGKVLEVMARNIERARAVVRAAIGRLGGVRGCRCAFALEGAIMSSGPISAETRKKLEVVAGPFLPRRLVVQKKSPARRRA